MPSTVSVWPFLLFLKSTWSCTARTADPVLPRDVMIRARQVAASATPLAVRWWARWNAITAFLVSGPNAPSVAEPGAAGVEQVLQRADGDLRPGAVRSLPQDGPRLQRLRLDGGRQQRRVRGRDRASGGDRGDHARSGGPVARAAVSATAPMVVFIDAPPARWSPW